MYKKIPSRKHRIIQNKWYCFLTEVSFHVLVTNADHPKIYGREWIEFDYEINTSNRSNKFAYFNYRDIKNPSDFQINWGISICYQGQYEPEYLQGKLDFDMINILSPRDFRPCNKKEISLIESIILSKNYSLL